ncbi:GDSL esterase/lipase 6 [Selaginella moellendorffii]|uniref:GDSL esterase/lipase 6 n=1 Tax=Selaginella moellendorffii TaxID=88036 RepID=UPI000D1CCB58|nr:GDSL esterase/lipase 6 [Selaginella moellendorffii]|eukprot:XP_024540397.1 GDSL esterase/lipase 6 [Selaginella moellendorffii]
MFRFLIAALLVAAATGALESERSVVPALFAFGDSLLDAGNNVYIANSSARVDFPPYGETFFHRPTGRFTNGRTIADFLAMHLGLPLLRPSLDPAANFSKGANFASGGSGLLESTSFDAGVFSMSSQIKQFSQVASKLTKEMGNAAHAKQFLSQALYIITSGSNDIGITYLENTTLQQTVKPQEFVQGLIHEYNKTILALHRLGARKMAIFELGVLGCTPFSRLVASTMNETGCLTQANQMGVLFNANLEQLVRDLRSQLPDMKIALGKTLNIFTGILNNATHYGFASTTSACCGAGPFNAGVSCGRKAPPNYPYKVATGKKPSRFLFWDRVHPTEVAYSLVFKQLWGGDLGAIEPFNLKQLSTMID